jgi:hypothetical protein
LLVGTNGPLWRAHADLNLTLRSSSSVLVLFMSKKSSVAAVGAVAAMALVRAAYAAPVPFEQSITLTNPEGSLVYNTATNGGVETTTSYYQLIVDPSWTSATKFTTYSTEAVGTDASYSLFTDSNPSGSVGDTGALLASWTQKDVPGNNLIPFFSFLLTTGQYVLQINTLPGQMNISTNIAAVPLPGAMWLFGGALLAFLGFSARRKM